MNIIIGLDLGKFKSVACLDDSDTTAARFGGWHCQGGKLFVRIDGSGADTSAWKFNLYGYATPMAFGR